MVICQNNKWIPSPSIHYLYLNLIPHSVISLFWRYFLWDVNIRKQLRLSWQVGYLGVIRVWFQPSLLMCWLKQQQNPGFCYFTQTQTWHKHKISSIHKLRRHCPGLKALPSIHRTFVAAKMQFLLQHPLFFKFFYTLSYLAQVSHFLHLAPWKSQIYSKAEGTTYIFL